VSWRIPLSVSGRPRSAELFRSWHWPAAVGTLDDEVIGFAILQNRPRGAAAKIHQNRLMRTVPENDSADRRCSAIDNLDGCPQRRAKIAARREAVGVSWRYDQSRKKNEQSVMTITDIAEIQHTLRGHQAATVKGVHLVQRNHVTMLGVADPEIHTSFWSDRDSTAGRNDPARTSMPRWTVTIERMIVRGASWQEPSSFLV
jgi:hypothetical protein